MSEHLKLERVERVVENVIADNSKGAALSSTGLLMEGGEKDFTALFRNNDVKSARVGVDNGVQWVKVSVRSGKDKTGASADLVTIDSHGHAQIKEGSSSSEHRDYAGNPGYERDLQEAVALAKKIVSDVNATGKNTVPPLKKSFKDHDGP